MKFITKFTNHSAYEAAESELALPNVSLCVNEDEVHYNPIVPHSRVLTAVFHITDTEHPTSITSENGWSSVESVLITRPNGTTFELSYDDLVQYDSITDDEEPYYAYQFDSIGDFTFEYTLKPNVDTIYGNLITYIPYVISVAIPNSVTSIGNEAFYQCYGLTSVTIPNSVTSIGTYAFDYCRSLTSVIIPNSVTSIGTYAFAYCSGLTSVTIGNSVTSIGEGTFTRCRSLAMITSYAVTAPTIQSTTFNEVNTSGTLYFPSDSSGYNTWMGTGNYYLGKYGWTSSSFSGAGR